MDDALMSTLAGGAVLAVGVIVFWMAFLMLIRAVFCLLRRDVRAARRIPGWVWFVASLLAVVSINGTAQRSGHDGLRLAASDVSVLVFVVVVLTLLARAVVHALRER